NLGIKDDAMVFDCDPIAKARAGNARALMNLASFTDDGLAFDVHVGMNHAVATDLRFVAHVCVGRIDESYAFIEHQASDRSAPKQVLEFSQLGARINTRDFAGVVMMIDSDFLIFAA